MLFNFFRIFYAQLFWKIFSVKNRITKEKILLILAGENSVIDKIAKCRFQELIEKRYMKNGIIIMSQEDKDVYFENANGIDIIYLTPDKIKLLYEYYCFYKFTNNIVFTYVMTPHDNKLQSYINGSNIDENDVVCLALFRLGHI